MLATYFTIPDSSFLGHFTGLIAGLLLKFGGLYILLPSYETINSFDANLDNEDSFLVKNGYYKCQPDIDDDFNAWFWVTIGFKIKHAFLKMR
jgi:hypothetical protein